jgi:glycosyltransferase involved in cell wall biosynthesis
VGLGLKGARRLLPLRVRAWLRAGHSHGRSLVGKASSILGRLFQRAEKEITQAAAREIGERYPVQSWVGVPRVRAAGRYRVLFVIKPGPFDASTTRYRTYNVIEALGQSGVEVGFIDVDELDQRQAEVLAHDLLVLMRRTATPAIHRLLDAAGKARVPVVFDIDDYVFDREAMPYLDYMKWFYPYILGYRETFDRCEYFTGSTPTLVERARRLGKKSHWIRNGLNSVQIELGLQLLKDRPPRQPGQRVRLGYFSGSSCHQGDFRIIAGPLARLLREYPQVEVMVAGYLDLEEFPELEPFRSRLDRPAFVDWRDLMRLLASVDINLAPMQCNPVYAAKSDLKYYEAGLVKVPSVTSPNPLFEESIRSGHNGLLAYDAEQWYQHLERLVTDEEYRRQLGENAHAHVLATYGPSSVALQALKAYRDILADHRLAAEAKSQGPTVVVLLSDLVKAIRVGSPVLDLVRGLVRESAHVSILAQPDRARELTARQAAAELASFVPVEKLAVGVGCDVPCCDVLIAADAAGAAWAHSYGRRAGRVLYLAAGHETLCHGHAEEDRRVAVGFGLGLEVFALDPVQADFLRGRHGCEVALLPAWNRACGAPPAPGHSPAGVVCFLEPGLSHALRMQVAEALFCLRLRQPQVDLLLTGDPAVLEASPELCACGPRFVPLLLDQALLAHRPVCLFPCGVVPNRQYLECQAAGCLVVVCSELPHWQAQASDAVSWAAPRAECILRSLEDLLIDPVRSTAQLLAGWARARKRCEPAHVAGLLLGHADGREARSAA